MGNFDGQGNSFSAQALLDLDLAPGLNITANNVTYTWPNATSGTVDNYQAAGQVLSLPAISAPVSAANTLAFLGSATNGPSSGTATLTYTDGTTQPFTLGFADWNILSTSSLPFGNSLVASMAYNNTATGQKTVNTSVFETEVSLAANKTLQSVILPISVNQGHLHVFAVGTRAGTYNNAGTSDEAQPFFANYDGGGNSYSQQALQNAGLTPGQAITVNGIPFTWPDVTAGLYNNNQASGQVIAVPVVSNATTLAFLGSATNGPSSGTATITYTDGTTQSFSLGFADWNSNSITSLPQAIRLHSQCRIAIRQRGSSM